MAKIATKCYPHPESTYAPNGSGGGESERLQKGNKGRGDGEGPSVRTFFERFLLVIFVFPLVMGFFLRVGDNISLRSACTIMTNYFLPTLLVEIFTDTNFRERQDQKLIFVGTNFREFLV